MIITLAHQPYFLETLYLPIPKVAEIIFAQTVAFFALTNLKFVKLVKSIAFIFGIRAVLSTRREIRILSLICLLRHVALLLI